MIKKYEIIEFKKVEEKINEPITKFGGQPVWIGEEEWPVSESWEGRKMMFVGQIAVSKNMLGNENAFVVYIFVTHPENCEDDFFDPDVKEWEGGENKVIIQTFDEEHTNKVSSQTGPMIFDKDNNHHEYIPVMEEGYDPEFITSEEYQKLSEAQQEEYFNSLDKNKIGGTPNFWREDAWPEGEWMLLLQLKCSFLPFELILGDMPVMYVFISRDFKRAGLLIQD